MKLLQAVGVILVFAGIISSGLCVDARAVKSGCVNDPNLMLDKYMELSSDHDNWRMDIFKRVPKGLRVVATSKKYIITKTVQDRVLPSDDAESLGNLIFNYEFRPLCRVENPRGRWWLVEPLKDRFLTYLPASAAEAEN